MKKVLRFLLRIFGWIPVPVKLLPKRYKERIAYNLLDAVEREDGMPEMISAILEEVENREYNKPKGSKFKNTEEEVDDALEKYPQLKPYRIYFLRVCERKRREVGLQA